MIDSEEIEEIKEQKKIDRAEDDRDFGPEDEGDFDSWLDKYEEGFGWDC